MAQYGTGGFKLKTTLTDFMMYVRINLNMSRFYFNAFRSYSNKCSVSLIIFNDEEDVSALIVQSAF